MSKVFKTLTLLCFSGALVSCALYPQSNLLLHNPPADLPFFHTIEGVPFFPQEQYQCGPAALAMMLQAQHIEVQPDELVAKVYVPEKHGSFQLELKAATRSFGLVPYIVPRTMEALFREIAANKPVLVLQNLGLEIVPLWHYAVVIGYDLRAGDVLLHSGLDESKRMAIGTFERSWAKNAPAWGMMSLLPDELPKQISPLQLAQNAEDMHAVGKTSAALKMYQAGLERWSGNDLLVLGIGNLSYQRGEYNAASGYFLSMLKNAPENTIAWNNLAYSLAEQGCKQALVAAQCALILGGEDPIYADTPVDVKAMLNSGRAQNSGCLTLPSCPL